MASNNVCWGIEIGAGAIKALKLVRDGDDVNVADFAIIPHKRVLSTPDIDENDAIRVALGALVNQHDLSKASIAVSVPGHAAFARFVKLPPVDPKKILDIVKFEAVQQIPFPIEEVEWDYQTFVDQDESPEVEVGIFAIARERVMERLTICADVSLQPDILNLSPVSVFNAIAYDQQLTASSPGAVILDIGTTASDLIVAEGGRAWVRTFPLGGHHFTEALVGAFKLDYRKAEKLKRDAEKSSHKKHIFQAMRPTFADLAQEVQRSIAYYRQLHPESDLTRMIGLGSTFRLLGLRKFISQQIQMDVERLDRLNKLNVEGAEASDFQSVTLNLGTAYGLALQGVGLGAINANLVPVPVIRQKVWKRKTPWFGAAAALSIAAGGVSFYGAMIDKQRLNSPAVDEAQSAVRDVKRKGDALINQWNEVKESANIGAVTTNLAGLFERQDLYSYVVRDVGEMFAYAAMDPQTSAPVSQDAPVEQQREFELRLLELDYITPSGGAPSAPGAPVIAGAAPAQDNNADRGRGRGGLAARGRAMQRQSGGSDRRRGRDGGQQTAAAPSAAFGKLDVVLVADSTNAGQQTFVEQTLLEWLRTNAERSDSPYTFTVPDIDEVEVIEMTAIDARTTKATSSKNPAAARAERSSGLGSNFTGGGSQQSTGGFSSAPPGSLTAVDEIAPLPSPPGSLPDNATVYRYTIRLEATLKAPGEHLNPTDDQQASAAEVTP